MGNRERWTIDELGVQVALALSVDYAGSPNGRIRDVPDRRTIRYYITLGLLDRPLEMRGRTALYGRRHLCQLVAIKRLQTKGLSLTEVQQRLLGLPDAALRRLAQVPEAESRGLDEKSHATPDEAADRRESAFWKAPPASARLDTTPALAPTTTLQGVTLDVGVTLLFETLRPVDDDDLQAIRAVAAPLLKLLERRRLVGRAEKGTRDE